MSIDCFGHRESARAVVRQLQFLSSPRNILIFGAWGTGKSTFLEHLNDIIEEEARAQFHVVRFNPWLYESSPSDRKSVV